MLKREKTAFARLGALGYSLVLVLQAPAAWGQTASDVVCSGCVESSDIQDGGVTGVDIQDGTITQDDIAVGGVGAVEIEDDSVPAEDLSNEAGVEFLYSPRAPIDISVTTVWKVMESLVVTAPSSGLVTCIGAGNALWKDIDLGGFLDAGWDDNFERTTPASYNRVIAVSGPDGIQRLPITSMHTFNVSAGTAVYSLKARCLGEGCLVNQMGYGFHSAACMFFPTRY